MNSILSHRSIRKFKKQQIPDDLLNSILEAGIRASNTGNMQLYSIIVTKEQSMLETLQPLHFNQKMVSEAPVHLTFCADIHRFHKWCELRGAKPGYDNLLWFLSAATDAILCSQNVCIAAESNNLGICYLGTILYNAEKFIEVLNLPKGVFPVAAISMGYPLEVPELTDRLPLNAVVHHEKYTNYSADTINHLFAEKENSTLTQELLKANNKPTLAHIFTENRYKSADNVFFSEKLKEILMKQGFLS